VKANKIPPSGFVAVSHDGVTGKTVGWEPGKQSAFAKYLDEAASARSMFDFWPAGTYELCGPKVNGNPEGLDRHLLLPHDEADVIDDVPLDFDGLRAFLENFPHEGIVWHHEDGHMAKLKVRDFPKETA
jgi:hypothetical protein